MWITRGLFVGVLWVLGLSSAEGAVQYLSGAINVNQEIPDNDSSGITSTHTVNSLGGYTITDVNVTINVSGGQNGDLFAKLNYAPLGGGGGYCILLNRVGRTGLEPFGYEDAGFSNVTLDDSAAIDVHVYGGGFVPAHTSYQPDGRDVSPSTVKSIDPRTAFLTTFNGMSANGTWTLTFSDWAGDNTSTLVNWSLDIQAVPEPVTTALMILGGVFGTFQFVRYVRRRKAPAA